MRHDAARDRRRQGRLALAHAPELVDDHGFRLVLQDVAEGARLERGEEVIVVVMDGDDDRLRLRLRFAQRDDDVDARSVGQAEVDQGDVDLLLGDDRQGAVDAGSIEEHRLGEHLGDLHLEPGARLGDVFQ